MPQSSEQLLLHAACEQAHVQVAMQRQNQQALQGACLDASSPCMHVCIMELPHLHVLQHTENCTSYSFYQGSYREWNRME